MTNVNASPMDLLKSYALYPLPQHALTRAIYWLTRRQSALTEPAIRQFVKTFNVNMAEAMEPDLSRYATFNAFFTRALKPEARPITSGDGALACPADGTVSAVGHIQDARLFQAKGLDYSLLSLLGGDSSASARLSSGSFATIYLSPRDYHRLHMPLDGQLIRQSYVPGRLFSVGPHTVRALPNLFTRNERVVAQFQTSYGLMALVLVGAMNVAAIETVWHGLVTPARRHDIDHIDYDATLPGVESSTVRLMRGAEMGRFNMGSTIIVLLENPVVWGTDIQPGHTVRMGQPLGQTG